MGKVVLLTGSPASGKSTLRRSLTSAYGGLMAVDYGEELLRLKAEEGSSLTYEEFRTGSAQHIEAAHVQKLDERVIARVESSSATSSS